MQRYHFRPYSPNQTILFPQRIDKDIADDDPVRLISSIVESLDLSSFRKLYRERGRSPYDPKMLLKVVIYAYMNNIYSCRRIEKSLKRDVHFIWLAGYEQPDFITDFGFFPNPTDTLTMIPFLSSFSGRYGHYAKETCADSG